ncbi:MAG TPA: hypothetical protein VE871_08425 [Longimicrobium sp.]|nr:hypothetical protein [Longimicrobium sp.]
MLQWKIGKIAIGGESLKLLEALQHTLMKKIEIRAHQATLACICQQPAKVLRNQIIVISALGIHRLLEIRSTVEPFMGLPMTIHTKRDSVSALQPRLG